MTPGLGRHGLNTRRRGMERCIMYYEHKIFYLSLPPRIPYTSFGDVYTQGFPKLTKSCSHFSKILPTIADIKAGHIEK